MEGILRFNDCNVRTNAAIGAHDPSMMWDPVTARYYSYSTDVYKPQMGLEERIGIPVRSSPDLIHFHYEGTVLSEAAVKEGRDNGSYPDTENFWAPYVEYVQGEYRMYYSATKAFGSSESRIWLAVAKHPLGPFENRGVVMDTWGTDDTLPNAIDAHIIWADQQCYLIYGSFFGGIYLKELDGGTGLPYGKDSRSLGICISRKCAGKCSEQGQAQVQEQEQMQTQAQMQTQSQRWQPQVHTKTMPITSPEQRMLDGPEGASIIYVPETGYYYLFQSYGWLGDNYDIRAGRSRTVTGPYLDWQGRDLVERSMGVKLANSYQFPAANPYAKVSDELNTNELNTNESNANELNTNESNANKSNTNESDSHKLSGERTWHYGGFCGPGHGVPFYDPMTAQYFFVHHVRDGSESGREYDEKEKRFSYREHYLMIRPMFFRDGWPVLSPEPYTGETFEPVSQEEGIGRWELILLDDTDNEQKLSWELDLDLDSAYLRQGQLHRCQDIENQKDTIILSGFTNSGLAYWGKILYSIV